MPECNDGVGFSICAEAWLGGRKPPLIMENSGLRVALGYIARISPGTVGPVKLHGPLSVGTLRPAALPKSLLDRSLRLCSTP